MTKEKAIWTIQVLIESDGSILTDLEIEALEVAIKALEYQTAKSEVEK